jgi:CBS-domain-containing membrane protein
MRAADVMTAPAIVVAPEATVEDVAKLLLRRGISAVPVVGSDGRLQGIVSRPNLIRGLASQPAAAPKPPAGDRALRERVEAEVRRTGIDATFVNVVASGGEVHCGG